MMPGADPSSLQANLSGEVAPVAADVPVGGTTGLCHQSSEAITLAATWYRANRQTCPRPVVPTLQHRFGLSIAEAISALREAAGR